MSPAVATYASIAGILWLLWLDRDPKVRTSRALWVPFLWLLIVCSRPVTDWVGSGSEIQTADQVQDGSPTDRLVYMGLETIGLFVLARRSRRVAPLLRANVPFLMCFGYCAISLAWSDFPGVAAKRWIKALGDLVMVVIVLTERNPQAAMKRLFARIAYVLITLSVLLIKYYPAIGTYYGPWGGKVGYGGVTTNKNTLGVVCLGLGLASLWSFLATWQGQKVKGRSRRMIAHGSILVMVFWLFKTINSMTSLTCFLMAGTLLVATSFRGTFRKPAFIHILIVAMLAISFSVVFLGLSPDALKTMGRDPTLTDRTEVWGNLLQLVQNPLLGTGFESFWLGPRLQALWALYWWHPSEAHNGYLEVYLNLGWVGVALLGILLVTGYRTAFSAWRNKTPIGSLALAYFYLALVYNFTEAAYLRMQAPAWIFFLFAITVIPPISNRGIRPAIDKLVKHAGSLNHEPELLLSRGG
jgi:exopolysaccharide production protein ExoQ